MATADDGINFPAYVIDGRRSVYQHMQDLADLCGFDLYINPMASWFSKNSSAARPSTYSSMPNTSSLLRCSTRRSSLEGGSLGRKPGGQPWRRCLGWLTKDFSGSKGTAGTGVRFCCWNGRRCGPATRRGTAAEAALHGHSAPHPARPLLSLGRPEVKLGDAIRLSGLADDSLNAVLSGAERHAPYQQAGRIHDDHRLSGDSDVSIGEET